MTSNPEDWGVSEKPPGSWREKHSGPLRFWGCGVYHHNGRFGHSGFSGIPSVRALDHFMKTDRKDIGMLKSRRWDTVSSSESRLATSTAPHYNNLTTQRIVGGIPISDESAWNKSGFSNQ